jgi:hypothetical protein
LIDSRLQAYFDSTVATDSKPHAIRAWMNDRGYVRTAVVTDRTYGPMEIYRLNH